MNKVYGMLGISAKAGKVVAGTDIVIENMKKKKVNLVIVAEDASEKTKKEMTFKCNQYNVKIIFFGDIDTNSKSIGKSNKAIIGIVDKGLAESIQKLIS